MPIDRLTRTTTVSGADLVPLWPYAAQDDQAATLATITAHIKDEIFPTNPPIVVTGSRSGGAALVSLISALVQLGLITDSTSA